MSIDYKVLGASIAEIRNQWGYTQRDVYNHTKVSIETQRRIEHGLKEPKISTLERLSILYKVDLLKLSLNARKDYSFFSDEMISFINRTVWTRDIETQKKEIDNYVKGLKAYQNSLEAHSKGEKTLIDILISFTDVLKSFSNDDFRYKEQNIISVERFLAKLDSSQRKVLQDPYHYNIEITLGLFLTSFYQLGGQYEKSHELLDRLDAALDAMSIDDKRIDDYKVAVALNKVVIFQLSGDYEAMYQNLESLLSNHRHMFKVVMLADCLCLKGIAMYYLDMEGYGDVLNTVLMMSDSSRRKFYEVELKRCGISITPPN